MLTSDKLRHLTWLKTQEENRLREEESQKKLIREVETKIKTTMIGALDLIEKTFGYLWKHGADVSQLSPIELTAYKQMRKLREDILNLGNNQRRNITREIENQYSVFWRKFK